MKDQKSFYLCPTCFAASEVMAELHSHRMVHVDEALLGDDLRRPPVDASGRLQSRAPRWFLELVAPRPLIQTAG